MDVTVDTCSDAAGRRSLALPIVGQAAAFSVVYIAMTTLLHAVGVTFELALTLGVCAALATHFTIGVLIDVV